MCLLCQSVCTWQEFLLPTLFQKLRVLLSCDSPTFSMDDHYQIEEQASRILPGLDVVCITSVPIPVDRIQPHGPNLTARELRNVFFLCFQEKNEVGLCYIYSILSVMEVEGVP